MVSRSSYRTQNAKKKDRHRVKRKKSKERFFKFKITHKAESEATDKQDSSPA